MGDILDPVDVHEKPRRFGVGPDDAILTMGKDVEYRFRRRSQLGTMLSTIVRHWSDGDALVRLYRLLYPYRDDFRRAPRGQFTGAWGKKWDLHVNPQYDPDDDWAPTEPALPAVKPRSPRTGKPVEAGLLEEVSSPS